MIRKYSNYKLRDIQLFIVVFLPITPFISRFVIYNNSNVKKKSTNLLI